MLLAALLYAYALAVLLAAGLVICRLFHRLFSVNFIHPALWPVLGMAGLTAYISILHLLLPISLWVHIIVMLSLVLLIILHVGEYRILLSQGYREVKAEFPLMLLLMLIAVLSITIRSGTGDIADYHLQGIKWAEYFANVKGLGNFNKPLANNYWWFNLQAFFGLHFLGVSSVYVMNSVLFTFITFYLYCLLQKVQNKWFILVLLLFLVLNIPTAFIGAVTPDVCIHYLTVICFVMMLQDENNAVSLAMFCLLFVFAITVKLTAIMLFPFLAITLFQQYRNIASTFRKWIALSLILLVCLIIPWLAGNIIHSGYLFPLFSQIDLFDADWKVPASVIEKERALITIWSRVPTQDIAITKQLSLMQWLPQWFAGYDLVNRVTIVITFVGALLLCVKSISAIMQKKYSYEIGLTITVILGLIMLFATSPQLRFMFGYVWLVIALSAHMLLFNIKVPLRIVNISIVCFMMLFALGKATSLHHKFGLQQALLQPPPYPNPEVKKVTDGNVMYYTTSQNNTCWDQFPCSYYMLEGTVLRGNELRDGFKIATSPTAP